MKATTILKLSLTEALAKIRAGGAVDEAEDHDLDIWAGVIPLKMTAGEPQRTKK